MDQLKFWDLLEISGHSDECLNETRKVFQKKYSETTFIVTDAETISETESGDRANVTTNVVKSLLYDFGDLIQKLEINFDEINDDSMGRKVVKIMDYKCATTLKSLAINRCHGKVLLDLKSEFIAVKTLTFSIRPLTKTAANWRLQTFFPNIEEFHLNNPLFFVWDMLSERFSNLTTFKYTPGADDDDYHDFITNHTKIEKLDLSRANLELLYHTNTLLPHLKSLTLNSLSDEYLAHKFNDVVVFENVQDLFIDFYNNEGKFTNTKPEKIIFERLRKLTLNAEVSNEWKNFISKQVNNDINTFTLSAAMLLDEDFLAIPEILTQLRRVNITTNSTISAKNIVKFVEKNKHFAILNIYCTVQESEQNDLRKTLEQNWSIELTTPNEDDKESVQITIG